MDLKRNGVGGEGGKAKLSKGGCDELKSHPGGVEILHVSSALARGIGYPKATAHYFETPEGVRQSSKPKVSEL